MHTRPYLDADTECYPDWWLIKFYMPDGRMYSIPRTRDTPLNREAVQWFIDNFTLVTFNGDNYDEPMITLAMSGADNWQLKQANDQIIKGGLKRWDFYNAYGLERLRNLDHVDVMEVAPGVRVGLKTYMGRMHSRKLQDLPYSPDEATTPAMRDHLDTYCGNDLVGTRELREVCAGRLRLREKLGERYGIDIRSKSDAQAAEAIIKANLPFKPEKRVVPHGWQFRYQPPAFIRFSTPGLQRAFDIIKNADFQVNDVDQLRSQPGEDVIGSDGKKIKTGIIMPLELKDLSIRIGGSNYKLGIGGLHSQESATQHHTTDAETVQEDDVGSYYPSLILNLGIEPSQLMGYFLAIYREIYQQRMEAKGKAKDKSLSQAERDDWVDIADGLKIVLNGTFGKLASKYSIFFAPELLIQVTITGQLCLLMLIESLERNGIAVVSANTDGIVTKCPRGREWLRDGCIKYWTQLTGLTMDSSPIRSLYSRDVNNYLSIKMDGTAKGKGAFAESGVLNNVHPEKDIVADSVVEFLKAGKPLDATIRACQDIRKFLVIRSVRGGGVYAAASGPLCNWCGAMHAGGPENCSPAYLGKTVRWYYAAGESRAIHYQTSGNKVAGSAGARPCMELPDAFPLDVDYGRYHDDAVKMLGTLGITYQ